MVTTAGNNVSATRMELLCVLMLMEDVSVREIISETNVTCTVPSDTAMNQDALLNLR